MTDVVSAFRSSVSAVLAGVDQKVERVEVEGLVFRVGAKRGEGRTRIRLVIACDAAEVRRLGFDVLAVIERIVRTERGIGALFDDGTFGRKDRLRFAGTNVGEQASTWSSRYEIRTSDVE